MKFVLFESMKFVSHGGNSSFELFQCDAQKFIKYGT